MAAQTGIEVALAKIMDVVQKQVSVDLGHVVISGVLGER